MYSPTVMNNKIAPSVDKHFKWKRLKQMRVQGFVMGLCEAHPKVLTRGAFTHLHNQQKSNKRPLICKLTGAS